MPAPPPAAGEERTQAGAVAAAERHLQLLNGPQMYDRAGRRALLEQVAAPDFRDDLPSIMEGYDRAAQLLGLGADGSSPTGDVVARTAVLGAEVTNWRGDRATVSLWTVGVLGVAGPQSSHPVQERWATEELDLLWHKGRWRWAGLTDRDGPVPVAGAQAPSPSEALRELPQAQVLR